MSHILTDGSVTVTLPGNMDWVDEYNWQPVQQAVQYSLTGALLVDEDTKQAGRPITLAPGNGNMGYLDRSALDTIKSWAAIPGQELTLTLTDGRAFTVRFRQGDGAISASPVRGFRVPAGTPNDKWITTLRFIEV